MPLSSRSPSAADYCNQCLAGLHSMCEFDPCCCKQDADLDVLFKHLDMDELLLLKTLREQYGLSGGDPAEGLPPGTGSATPKQKGNSGYIHPDAWPSTEDIGTLSDPLSSGRKRQARMYPITKGTICEWAAKIVKLGDLPEVVGCINSPAMALHHGPDKNTLNNEKASHGIGVLENTHIICDDCHNSLHAKHNSFYPAYDRVAQQAEPWLPNGVSLLDSYILEDAPFEMLVEEERRRMLDRERRGKITRGRKARKQEEGDFGIEED